MFQQRILRRFLPLACLALVLGLGSGLRHAEAVDLSAALQDLDQLKKSSKSKSTNEDMLQYLDAVANEFKGGIDKPAAPAEDASPEEKKAHAAAVKKFKDNLAKFQAAAEKVFLKYLTLEKVKAETNIRDDVNIKAAVILGELGPFLDAKGRKKLSKKIMKDIEKKLTKVKTHEVNTDLLDAVFAALGHLNDPSALLWMNDNYTHTKDNEKQYLIAAHKAMVLFTNVEGKLRYEICATFNKNYAGVELQAEQVSTDTKIIAKKNFWDAIKAYTIPVMQHFAGEPTDEEGAALAEMKQFSVWMRKNKSPKAKPWRDAVPKRKK